MNRIAEIATVQTVMHDRMTEVETKRVSTVLGQITRSVNLRMDYQKEPEQLFNGAVSKDVKHLDALKNDTVARFFVAIGVAPEYYINSPAYDSEVFESKSKIPSEAKTKNLKAYKKFAETAHYFASGSKLESVLKVFVACSIVSSQYHTVIPRDVCTKFLNAVPLNHISEELAEALDTYRDKTMTGGADTQTSQCTLTIASMRGAVVIRNGRQKDFALDVNSPVIESFAQRFNLVPQLERARAYRATMEAQVSEVVTAD